MLTLPLTNSDVISTSQGPLLFRDNAVSISEIVFYNVLVFS
nr:MAG TPA: hypothetical protein [Crassvirales sp.]